MTVPEVLCAWRRVCTGALHLYVARHGQTDWNAERRLQGGTDIPLNAQGLLQARDLAERMSAIPFLAVYCSALQRSRQTADIVAEKLGCELQILAELNEQKFGA